MPISPQIQGEIGTKVERIDHKSALSPIIRSDIDSPVQKKIFGSWVRKSIRVVLFAENDLILRLPLKFLVQKSLKKTH